MNHWGSAESARRRGLVPASKIKQIPVPLIKKWARVAEICPIGDFQTPVNFYDPLEVKALFGLIQDIRYPEDPWATLDLKDYKKKKSVTVHPNCLVKWLDWEVGRKSSKAHLRVEIGCKVTIKGQFAFIETPSKVILKKKLTTKGFSFKMDSNKEGNYGPY